MNSSKEDSPEEQMVRPSHNSSHQVSPYITAPDDEVLREKYETLLRQVDDIVAHSVDRSNHVLSETQIEYLILNQVFNASNDGIWAINKDHTVLRANNKLLSILGKPANDVIGKKCNEVFPACKAQGEWEEQMLNREEPEERQITLTLANGETIPFMVIVTPLLGLDGETIGAVETFTDISEHVYAEELLRCSNKELAQITYEDSVTELLNRRHFDECLALEWRRQRREGNPISLIMCDVDFFKGYNDTHGHQAGDACLRVVAAAIKKSIHRPGDVAARYGGDEFAIILPATDAKGARYIAQQVHDEVAKVKIPHGQSPVGPYVTISCGSATMVPKDEVKPQTLIESADRRLYRAKTVGRNRIVSK